MNVTTSVRCSLVAPVVLLMLSGCAQLGINLPGGMTDMLKQKAIEEASKAALSPEVTDRVGSWAVNVWLKTKHVVRDTGDNQIANSVMNNIIAAAKRSELGAVAEKLKWEIMVVDDPDINAVAVPGGKVIVNTGLTRFAKGKSDVLAVALAHEVVHALARDPATRISKGLRDELVTAFAGVDLANHGLSPEATAGVMAAMGLAYYGADVVPFAREQEVKADHVGLLLMGYAKYDPQAAIKFWKDRMTHTTSRTPGFLQMHPTDETRISQLQEWMPQAVQLFRQARVEAPAAGVGG
jgi:predicted Zn-dependent protease